MLFLSACSIPETFSSTNSIILCLKYQTLPAKLLEELVSMEKITSPARNIVKYFEEVWIPRLTFVNAASYSVLTVRLHFTSARIHWNYLCLWNEIIASLFACSAMPTKLDTLEIGINFIHSQFFHIKYIETLKKARLRLFLWAIVQAIRGPFKACASVYT